MPSHTHYVEPYFGGGAVLLAKAPEGVSEVVNDIDGLLTNFWRCLQSRFAFGRFKRLCEATPFSEEEWRRADEYLKEKQWQHSGETWTVAHAFFVCCRQSLAGRMDTFASLSKTRTRRGMNEQASAWLTAIEGLPAVHARLKRVAILTGEALDVIRQQDGEKTLFYCDPPYLKETRVAGDVYRHEMTDKQHSVLLHQLTSIRGKFLLSGYRSEKYDSVADEYGWRRVDFDLPNNAAGGKAKRRMTESVWMNYPAPD
jgi:DNA adenine methylase